jgi:hypothetical protein
MKRVFLKQRKETPSVNLVTVDVFFDAGEEVSSFNLSLGYDAEQITPIEIPTVINQQQGCLIPDNQIPGLLKFGWHGMYRFPADIKESVLTIVFERKVPGVTASDIVFVEDGGIFDDLFNPIADVAYEGTAVIFASIPVFPEKSKVSERKAMMGYTSKPVMPCCGNCGHNPGRCQVGDFKSAKKGKCNYHQW